MASSVWISHHQFWHFPVSSRILFTSAVKSVLSVDGCLLSRSMVVFLFKVSFKLNFLPLYAGKIHQPTVGGHTCQTLAHEGRKIQRLQRRRKVKWTCWWLFFLCVSVLQTWKHTDGYTAALPAGSAHSWSESFSDSRFYQDATLSVIIHHHHLRHSTSHTVRFRFMCFISVTWIRTIRKLDSDAI